MGSRDTSCGTDLVCEWKNIVSSLLPFTPKVPRGVAVLESKTGAGFCLVAAMANASFALPMKWMPRWSWENIWSVWSVCSLLVFPFLAALYTVPALAVGYHEVAVPVIARVVFYGFAWGIAEVFFGLSVETIGMALTFSIVLGSSAAIGTLLPFIRLHSELLFTAAGGFILAGVFFVAWGMVLCALAGFRRENKARAMPVPQRSNSFRTGLIIASVSGLIAGFINMAISLPA